MMASRKLWCLAPISTSSTGTGPRTSVRRPTIQAADQRT